MKTLIVYFSYSGNNRLLAEYLAERIEGDLCPIVETKRRTMLTIILDMLFRRTPKIEALERSVSSYHHIVLVAPIWDSKLANPMKALIRSEKGSLLSYSFISLCGYERSGQKESITMELSALTGRMPKAVCELKIADLFPPERRREIKTLSSYHATREDLAEFEPKIDEFLKRIRSDEARAA